MTILYTNDIGTFFDETLLGHIKREENSEALSILKNADPCQLSTSLGTTLLHFAGKYDNVKFAQHLIDLGMSVDVQNRFAETPLTFAVDANGENTVKMLLKAKANPLVPDVGGRCPLGKALVNKHNISDDIIKALLDSITVDLLKRNIEYVKSERFHDDCKLYHFIPLEKTEITRVLLESGGRVDAKNLRTHSTALHVAAARLDLGNVKLLLESRANVNAKRRDGLTPLACIACHESQGKALAIVKALLAAGAELIDRKSRKILVWPILSCGNREIIRTVLQSDINLKFRDEHGETALHYLARNEQPDVLKEVRDLQSAVRVRSSSGSTMLHEAAVEAKADTIEYLLNNGANVNAEDQYAKTPLDYAIHTRMPFEKFSETFYNHLHSIDVLLERGAHPRLIRASRFENYQSDKDKFIQFTEPVLAHLALLEASGQTIEESMQIQIESFESYKITFASVKRELNEMKQITIGQSSTLLDFLIASDQQISLYARNKNITMGLNRTLDKYSSKDSYYHRKLQRSFAKFTELLEKRKNLAIAVTAIFHELHNVSVNIVAEMIVNFLRDQELYNN